MSPEKFAEAKAELQSKGIIPAGHGWMIALASRLDLTRQTVGNFEREGTKRRQTDYAIAALLAGLPPYGESDDA
ncbi:MAG: hypothetical protein J0H18_15270 [Rhizobiales bacterium]|nr:hypothetical protein [Hyphomicrobiales bacterium]OJX99113.1 MAG: hypothetical protein BGP07_03390 [Rhizobiales bacterium 63-22]